MTAVRSHTRRKPSRKPLGKGTLALMGIAKDRLPKPVYRVKALSRPVQSGGR